MVSVQQTHLGKNHKVWPKVNEQRNKILEVLKGTYMHSALTKQLDARLCIVHRKAINKVQMQSLSPGHQLEEILVLNLYTF